MGASGRNIDTEIRDAEQKLELLKQEKRDQDQTTQLIATVLHDSFCAESHALPSQCAWHWELDGGVNWHWHGKAHVEWFAHAENLKASLARASNNTDHIIRIVKFCGALK